MGGVNHGREKDDWDQTDPRMEKIPKRLRAKRAVPELHFCSQTKVKSSPIHMIASQETTAAEAS